MNQIIKAVLRFFLRPFFRICHQLNWATPKLLALGEEIGLIGFVLRVGTVEQKRNFLKTQGFEDKYLYPDGQLELFAEIVLTWMTRVGDRMRDLNNGKIPSRRLDLEMKRNGTVEKFQAEEWDRLMREEMIKGNIRVD